jgi:hypothetical protein
MQPLGVAAVTCRPELCFVTYSSLTRKEPWTAQARTALAVLTWWSPASWA